MKLWLRLIGIAIFLFEITTTSGQQLPTVTIKTPEVAAFNRFIETPVSHYTGVPNISIPLYEISMKGVTVPITLNYHAGGIRVDQDATWVGLGWSLSYGGEISRKVRGSRDENYFYKAANLGGQSVESMKEISKDGRANLEPRLSLLQQAKFNKFGDYMPDEFYYSTLGHSGRFMFSQPLDKFVLFPQEDIAIKAITGITPSTSNPTPFYAFNLLLPDGTSIDYGKEGVVREFPVDAPAGGGISAWNVKTIRNIYNDSIAYTYENFNYTNRRLTGIKVSMFKSTAIANGIGLNGMYDNINQCISAVSYADSRIKTIKFPGGIVTFNTMPREDAYSLALQEINVQDDQGRSIRRVVFHYSYFFGNAFDMLPELNPLANFPESHRFKRLRLDSIKVMGAGTEVLNYKFDYNTSADMPSKVTFAQDHWGFYNGIANTTRYSFIPDLVPTMFKGGDRRVKAEKSKVFSLKSVTYPEGGKAEFLYEGNDAKVGSMPLNEYQDDNNNVEDKTAGITISSYSRNTSYPSPDSVTSGKRFFIKRFTTPNGLINHVGYSWECSTNFGISELEQNMPAEVNNVDFSLQRYENNQWVVVKSFNTATYSVGQTYNRTGKDNGNVTLIPAEYRLVVCLSYSNPPNSPADMQPYNLGFVVKWREVNYSRRIVNVGGLRIKDINYYDSDGKLARKKSYRYQDRNESVPTTSGKIVSIPIYYQYNVNRVGGGGILDQLQWGLSLYSNSVLPLETTAGSYCGYEYVDEYTVDNVNSANNLRTNYMFSFAEPYFSEYFKYNYLGITEPQEWRRGKLLTTDYYKGDKVIKSDSLSYYDWSPHLSNPEQEEYAPEINTNLISFQYLNYMGHNQNLQGGLPEDFYDDSPKGIQYYDLTNFQAQGLQCPIYYFGIADYTEEYALAGYYGLPGIYRGPIWVRLPYLRHYSSFDKPKSKTSTIIDDKGNRIVSVENYLYEKTPVHYQLTQTQVADSKKETRRQVLQYPADFSALQPYTTMLQRHIISPVVQQADYKDGTFLQSSGLTFKDWGNNIIAPVSHETKQGTNAIQTRTVFDGYDNIGNLLSTSKAGDVKTVCLWGYKGQYPVAKIEGADYNTVKQIVQQSILDAPVTDQQLRDELNKLRTQLSGALVTTYTYLPLIGMTSETSPANRTVYYEYDGMGRLKLLRDQDGKILKMYDYKYQQPITQ